MRTLQKYYRVTLVILTLLTIFNISIFHTWRTIPKEASQSNGVKGLWISRNGSLKISLSGLLLPADEPTDTLMRDPIVNEHNFKYIHNPTDICVLNSVDFLVGVVSSAGNFVQRRLARRHRSPPADGVIYVFFLGKFPFLTGIQQRVDKEAEMYGDIVQEDFIDTPRNLSLKSVAILKWTTEFCSRAKFVLKKDDDVKLNAYNIMLALQKKTKVYQHFVMGNSKYLVEGPIRDAVSKYYTSVNEFEDAFFPTFVHGPAYGFPGVTARLLYQVALRTKLFWLEDVYITGICAHRVNIPVFFDKDFVYKHESIDAV